jgi:hypothetical protein
VVIPGYQFIKKMRQAISIRYASIRIAINFIKNTRISTLKIMHPFKKGQLLGRLLIGIISGTNSHESRTRGTILSHVQSLKHYLNTLPALRAQ